MLEQQNVAFAREEQSFVDARHDSISREDADDRFEIGVAAENRGIDVDRLTRHTRGDHRDSPMIIEGAAGSSRADANTEVPCGSSGQRPYGHLSGNFVHARRTSSFSRIDTGFRRPNGDPLRVSSHTRSSSAEAKACAALNGLS
jgi:hypothetical protein